MATTTDYINQLKVDKTNLVNNLVTKGVDATEDETFTSLVPKVLNISGGGSSEYNTIIDDTLLTNTSETDNRPLLRMITKFPNTIDTSEWTSHAYMFSACSNVEEMPTIDTSNSTNMEQMFNACTKIKTIPQIDTSKVTKMRYMFRHCYVLESIPELDTSQVTDMTQMFRDCRKLVAIPKLDTSNITDMNALFSGCNKLAQLPQLNTSKVTNMNSTFSYCNSLIELKELDCSNVTSVLNMFYQSKGKPIIGGFLNLGKAYTEKTTGYTHYALNLTGFDLTYESLMNIINKLYDLNLTYDVANGGTLYTQKLQLGATNTSKLTSEEIAIATNKGWVVS